MSLVGVDIFSGAGGMSTGAEWAGISSVFAIDSDLKASRTYQLNHPETEVVCGDVQNFDFTTVNLKKRCVLFGGPPCQGFSTSNQRTRSGKNEANWLFKEFLRSVAEIEPSWVIFENVKGISVTENADFLNRVINGLEKLGYATKNQVLNAADFGVPQLRFRLFLVASREIDAFKFPKPEAARPISVREAITDLPKLCSGSRDGPLRYRGGVLSEFATKMRGNCEMSYNNSVTNNSLKVIERYRYIPQGGNWSCIPNSLMQNYRDVSRCHTGIYRRLCWDSPSITIGNYRKNMLVHPEQDRGLSVREAARLQSFPDAYKFFGSIGFQQQQVGNAVPPLLAKAVFQEVISADKKTFETKFSTEC